MKSKAITGMMLTLVLTSILAAISLVSVSHAQPPDGNWMVTSVEVVENKTVVLNGNLTVKGAGSLTLRNVTLRLNVTENGQYGISVEPGGSLFIYESNIGSATAFRFFFYVVGGRFVIKDSELRGAGWGEQWAFDTKKRGLYVEADNALIEGNFVSDSHGVKLVGSRNSSIINNELIPDWGITIAQSITTWQTSNHNFILNNTIYQPWDGIHGLGDGNVISNNVIFDPQCVGIYASGASWNNTITDNRVIVENRSSAWGGIVLWNGCGNNTIANNTIQNLLSVPTGGGNIMVGISIVRSVNNRIEGNSIERAQQAIILSYSHNNLVADNVLSNISQGVAGMYGFYIPSCDAIQLYHSSSNVVINNRVSSVQSNAIILWGNASNNILQANVINSSYYCISLHYSSDNNTIVNNAMSKILSRAMILDESNGNIVYHNNFLDPVVDAYDSGRNHWSFGGQGNYWGDYEGQDTDGNGIGDVPRYIPPNGTDGFPLMNPNPVTFAPIPKLELTLPPTTGYGGIEITAEETWKDTVVMSGYIAVKQGGALTLQNVTLMMGGGCWEGIYVEHGGSMYIYNSTITAVDPKYGGYCFFITDASEFVMRNSELHYAGWNFLGDHPGGLAIWTNPDGNPTTDVIIENSVFKHNCRSIYVAAGDAPVRIVNNTISHSFEGVTYNTGDVLNNTISKIVYAGVFGGDGANLLANNNITHVWGGAVMVNKAIRTVINNTISSSEVGILLFSIREPAEVSVVNNVINDVWRWAIQTSQCEYPSANVVANNTISSCAGGIYLAPGSLGNRIYHNNITSNGNGIWLHSSSNNTLSGNNITANNGFGIGLWNSSGNLIYHNNFINNTDQVYTENSFNSWDSGYPSGGNYWSDYTGVDLHNGAYQNETGSDAIGDTPYTIDENNRDRYPLIAPTYTSMSYFHLAMNSTAGGTTNPPPGTHNYAAGSPLNVTAVPSSGYSFDYWLLDGEERTENPIGVTMDTNHTLEAFFVDDVPPEIDVPTQEPPEDVTPYQNLTVTVNVTDFGTGVRNVTLWYSINNGTTWTPLNMTETSSNTYQATIPGKPNCTWVKYKIIAYDNAENHATKDNNQEYYVYHVIPEYPSLITLTLIVTTTLLAAIVYRRKHSMKC